MTANRDQRLEKRNTILTEYSSIGPMDYSFLRKTEDAPKLTINFNLQEDANSTGRFPAREH